MALLSFPKTLENEESEAKGAADAAGAAAAGPPPKMLAPPKAF